MVPVDGIRYDYSRAREPKNHLHGHDFTPTYHFCWSDGATANKKNPHAELEALIADVLDAYEDGRNHDAKQRPAREYHIEGITPTVPEGFIATGLTKDEFRNKLQAFANEWVRLEVERFSVGDEDAEKRRGLIIDATPDQDGPFPIRCNVDAIEMFVEERERAVAKARREALEIEWAAGFRGAGSSAP